MTNEISWRKITNNWQGVNHLQLWWANTTNGDKSYMGWNMFQFGDWHSPVMHQFAQNTLIACNVTGNKNWFI